MGGCLFHGNGSGLSSMTRFDISGVKLSDYITGEMVNVTLMMLCSVATLHLIQAVPALMNLGLLLPVAFS